MYDSVRSHANAKYRSSVQYFKDGCAIMNRKFVSCNIAAKLYMLQKFTEFYVDPLNIPVITDLNVGLFVIIFYTFVYFCFIFRINSHKYFSKV